MIAGAGHDVPARQSFVAALNAEQVFGEDLEQHRVTNRRDAERALGPVKAEPSALAASDGERRDLTAANRRNADLRRDAVAFFQLGCWRGREHWRRIDFAGQFDWRALFHEPVDQRRAAC